MQRVVDRWVDRHGSDAFVGEGFGDDLTFLGVVFEELVVVDGVGVSVSFSHTCQTCEQG